MEEMSSPFVTHAEFDPIAKTQSRIVKFLFGNGDPGLDETLRSILKWIEAQEAKMERKQQWWDKLQWVIIPLVIIAILGFFGQMIYFYVKVVPLMQ